MGDTNSGHFYRSAGAASGAVGTSDEAGAFDDVGAFDGDGASGEADASVGAGTSDDAGASCVSGASVDAGASGGTETSGETDASIGAGASDAASSGGAAGERDASVASPPGQGAPAEIQRLSAATNSSWVRSGVLRSVPSCRWPGCHAHCTKDASWAYSVSYTHLTLPTILRV